MAEPFNIDRFMESSGRVDLSDIDWSDVPKHPVTPEARRTLRYFLVTESSTFFYLKSLMQTQAAWTEPDFAPFLCAWNYEEEFHGRAFKKFMDALGEPVEAGFRGERFTGRSLGERIDEVTQTALSYVFPEAWPGVHMTWGAIQEMTTYTAYQALIERVQHPVLTTICQRIMKQELKHFAFYYGQARRRLADPAAQKLAKMALTLAWTPVGDGMSSKDEACHAIRFLFDGRDGNAIGNVEKKVRDLPGMGWFDLFSKYAVKHDIRRAPDSWFPKKIQRSSGVPAELSL